MYINKFALLYHDDKLVDLILYFLQFIIMIHTTTPPCVPMGKWVSESFPLP